jgi:hypothetical protein
MGVWRGNINSCWVEHNTLPFAVIVIFDFYFEE